MGRSAPFTPVCRPQLAAPWAHAGPQSLVRDRACPCSPLLAHPSVPSLSTSTTKPIGMGAAYGTAKSGVGIASMGVMRPELVM